MLPLHSGERVLSAARAADGSWVAATATALVTNLWRTEWVDVLHAEWQPDDGALVLDGAPGVFGRRRVPLADPGRLPETVHERVMSSIVVTRRISVPGTAGGVRAVGRRVAGSDSMTWQVIAEDGVDGTDPRVQELGDALVRRLKAELGPAASG